MPLDAATAALAATGRLPLNRATAEQVRVHVGKLDRLIPPGPPMHRVEQAQAGAVAVRVLVPIPEPVAVIVYLHGGGWTVGSLEGYDSLGRHLAARTGGTVVLVDYRLAPEHPFPGPVNDCFTALRWTAERLDRIAGRPVPLIVAGDSAGGNLAAVMTLRARATGGPEIARQVLVYPVTDCVLDRPSYLDLSNHILLDRDTMAWFWDQYAPHPADRVHPDASPLRAADLAGLPETDIVTAEYDVLRDEGEAYAARLIHAGVPVRIRRCLGQAHGFLPLVGLLPGSAEAIDHIATGIATITRVPNGA